MDPISSSSNAPLGSFEHGVYTRPVTQPAGPSWPACTSWASDPSVLKALDPSVLKAHMVVSVHGGGIILLGCPFNESTTTWDLQ